MGIRGVKKATVGELTQTSCTEVACNRMDDINRLVLKRSEKLVSVRNAWRLKVA